jgi:hypothetical protein
MIIRTPLRCSGDNMVANPLMMNNTTYSVP